MTTALLITALSSGFLILVFLYQAKSAKDEAKRLQRENELLSAENKIVTQERDSSERARQELSRELTALRTQQIDGAGPGAVAPILDELLRHHEPAGPPTVLPTGRIT